MDFPYRTPSFSKAYSDCKNPEQKFQDFVGELFLPEVPGLSVFSIGGKDGCIDLFGLFNQTWTVWECKYSSKEGKDVALSRWREVERVLDKYLTDNGPGAQNQYTPWYDTSKPIKSYKFCFSGSIGRRDQISFLEQEIQQAFQKWGERSPCLNHLKNIEVEVLPWEVLGPKVVSIPSQNIKWFFPKEVGLGLSRLDDWLNHSIGFKKYLNSPSLEYFPIPGLAPASILQQLEDSEFLGVLIHGKGGTGKSRLLAEIGRLGTAQGWVVLVITPSSFDSEGLKWVMTQTQGVKTILIADYLEKWLTRDEICDELARFDHPNIKILGSCRNSFMDQIDRENKLYPIEISDRHITNVVSQILATIPQNNIISEFCNNIPVFAVFAKYLYDNNKLDDIFSLTREPNFSTWLSNRLPPSNPQSEVSPAARLVATYPCTDLHLDAWITRCTDVLAVHSFLSKDGWVIGGNGDPYEIAHDVITDRILISQSLNHQKFRTIRRLIIDAIDLKTIPQFIAVFQRIREDFMGIPWLKLLTSLPGNIIDNVTSLLENNILDSGILSYEDAISLVELIADANRQTFLVSNPKLRVSIARLCHRYSKRRDIQSPSRLGTLTSWLSSCLSYDQDNFQLLGTAIRVNPEYFQDIALDKLSSNRDELKSSYIIVSLISNQATQEVGFKFALNWLDQHSHRYEAIYILKEFANNTKYFFNIKPYYIRWLESPSNALAPSAGLIFRTWLRADQNPTDIINKVHEWLSIPRNRNGQYSPIVLEAWVRNSHSPRTLENQVQEWLKNSSNSTAFSARFLLSALLRSGYPPESISDHVKNWLNSESNSTYLFTQRLFKDWIHAGGSWENIAPYYSQWKSIDGNKTSLESSGLIAALLKFKIDLSETWPSSIEWLEYGSNLIDIQASYILGPLLESGYDSTTLWPSIQNWLEFDENKLANEAFGIYGSWLKMNSPIEKICNYVLEWFEVPNNASSPVASFIFKPWFNYPQHRDLLRSQLKAWLRDTRNCTALDTENVFEAWIINDGDMHFLENEISKWLEHGANATSPQARFIFTAYLGKGVPIIEIRRYVQNWLGIQENRVAPKTQHVFHSWIEADAPFDDIEPAIREWMSQPTHRRSDGASFVIPGWLKKKSRDIEVSAIALEWLSVQENIESNNSQYVICAWLDSGRNPGDISNYVISWLMNPNRLGSIQASYLLQSWIQAKGGIDTIEQFILKWIQIDDESHLVSHATTLASAIFLNPTFSQELITAIQQWVIKHVKNSEIGCTLSRVMLNETLTRILLTEILYWCQMCPKNPRALSILERTRKYINNNNIMEFAKAAELIIPNADVNKENDKYRPIKESNILNILCQLTWFANKDRDLSLQKRVAVIAISSFPKFSNISWLISNAIPWQIRLVPLFCKYILDNPELLNSKSIQSIQTISTTLNLSAIKGNFVSIKQLQNAMSKFLRERQPDIQTN